MEASEAAAIRDQLRPFLFEDLPDRPLGPLRMGVRFRPGQTFMEEPGVQLVIALEPQPRREEAFAHEADLVLDLALLPARGRRAGDRLDEMVRAHSRFTYAVRPSSTEFFDALVRYAPDTLPDNVPAIRKQVENQSWFFLLWRLDPTIQSALVMLEAIHGLFRPTNGLFARA